MRHPLPPVLAGGFLFILLALGQAHAADVNNRTFGGFTGLQSLRALVAAYPDDIRGPYLRNGDWAIVVGPHERLFYWSDGRLLPEEARFEPEAYARYSFEYYPLGMPPLPELTEEEAVKLNTRVAQRETEPLPRHQGFLEELWGFSTWDEADATMEWITFLDLWVRVHRRIVEPLAAIEADLLNAAEDDAAVASWLGEIETAGAFVWRNIAGTSSRSYHAYGLAVDLMPSNYGRRQVYWRWSRDLYRQWWAVPYEERFPVPLSVVDVFEDHGFIWGGKWFFFDQIHFEYRPELIILRDFVQDK